MARRPAARFQDLVETATAVFIAQGYRRTQIADVARAMGVAKGTVYLYVESKEALFDLVLRSADAPRPLATPPVLPVRTPSAGASLRYVRARLTEARPTAAILDAAARRRAGDVGAELASLLRGLYSTMARQRTGIKLVDRCAADYPELARVWFALGREAVVGALARYLETRHRTRQLAPMTDVAVAARLIVETIVFWAVHRHWDPAPQAVNEAVAEMSVVRLLTNTLLPRGLARPPRAPGANRPEGVGGVPRPRLKGASS
jgi:AcrR family transcriptional regulator